GPLSSKETLLFCPGYYLLPLRFSIFDSRRGRLGRARNFWSQPGAKRLPTLFQPIELLLEHGEAGMQFGLLAPHFQVNQKLLLSLKTLVVLLALTLQGRDLLHGLGYLCCKFSLLRIKIGVAAHDATLEGRPPPGQGPPMSFPFGFHEWLDELEVRQDLLLPLAAFLQPSCRLTQQVGDTPGLVLAALRTGSNLGREIVCFMVHGAFVSCLFNLSLDQFAVGLEHFTLLMQLLYPAA